MGISLIEERDNLSQAFGDLQTRYNQSLAGVVESYGTLVSALESISDAQALSVAQKTAKAALARVNNTVSFTSDPTHALRQEEIDAQVANLPQPTAQPAAAPTNDQPSSVIDVQGTVVQNG